MADSKKAHFSKSPILEISSRKSLRSVLGLVGLNDAKGIVVAQRTVEDDNSFSLPKKRNIFSSCFQYSERAIHSTERNFTSAERS